MIPDERDTIVAVASARQGAARGVVRLSGPDAISVVERIIDFDFSSSSETRGNIARRYDGLTASVLLNGRTLSAPCDVFVWPGKRSYTRQPSAELHTIGSQPVVDALVDAACRAGARLAEPGEFTLRAFLAGRIDLTQAEAVLGVIEAAGDEALRAALGQLAGGLSAPLGQLREDLVQLLAELEAGLDFVDEEDIRFIEQEELIARLAAGAELVESLIKQTAARGRRESMPRVVLAGPPNAGKSSLFNAIRKQWGVSSGAATDQPALVSSRAGTTRDSVSAEIEFHGLRFHLIDTAGQSTEETTDVDTAAQRLSTDAATAADLLLLCRPADQQRDDEWHPPEDALLVQTKSDLTDSSSPTSEFLPTSSHTDEGLTELLAAIVQRLQSEGRELRSRGVATTAERCQQALASAQASLQRATDVAHTDDHELAAFEIRTALDDLGQVVGAVVTDDLLDRIFSQFCIGK